MQPRSEPDIVSLATLATYLSVDRKTLSRHLKDHPGLPGVMRVGRQWRINLEVFTAAMNAGTLSPGVAMASSTRNG